MKGLEAIKGFKAKHGPVKKELLDWIKKTNASMAAIRKSLGAGPKTVPEISSDTGITSHETLWFINAMRKYGEVVINGDIDGFKKYSLKEEGK
ncbi:MAG TPA: MarR family transcriptional regulator [Candidatus Goldiibacteriota bacterium]|nr:MarR family transcriptional regulator [Candidatus Goldiibacteriota bacterium]